MAITPIPTRYDGHHFRSRLEARWAVFFNAAGIEYRYETEGWAVGPYDDQRPYLPDFWLPQLEQWVEVKGTLPKQHERGLILHAAVTHKGWGLPDNASGVLLLGDIPHLMEGVNAFHPRFWFHKGDIIRTPTSLVLGYADHWTVVTGIDASPNFEDAAKDCTGSSLSVWNPAPSLYDDCWWAYASLPPELKEETFTKRSLRRLAVAANAARSARFEHGQSGPT